MATLRARRTESPDIIRNILLSGLVYQRDADGRRLLCPDISELETFWKKHETELTAEYSIKAPGQRPFAWWAWSIPAGLPKPSFDWALMQRHRLGGVDARNRERPSGFQQTQYLREQHLLSAAEDAVLAAQEAAWAAIGEKRNNVAGVVSATQTAGHNPHNNGE